MKCGIFVVKCFLLKLNKRDLYFVTGWNADIEQEYTWLGNSVFHFQFDTLILINTPRIFLNANIGVYLPSKKGNQ